MAKGLRPPFDPQAYREGHLTPVYFGSALNNFGVRELLAGVGELAPAPRPQPADPRPISPEEPKVAGFVFKVQANIDPQHRDRIAFVRIASGRFQRGMKLKNIRTGRVMSVQAPVFFLARERNLAEEAWPGDIIGIPNHGSLRIGDTLTEGEAVRITGIPNFAPEILQRVKVEDPMKSKHLEHVLEQLAEEGVTRVFKPLNGGDWIVGVVGALQLDVLTAGSPPNTTCRPASTAPPIRRRAGSMPTRRPSSNASASRTRRPAPRTMTASPSSSPATPGTCARQSRNGPGSASRKPASRAEARVSRQISMPPFIGWLGRLAERKRRGGRERNGFLLLARLWSCGLRRRA